MKIVKVKHKDVGELEYRVSVTRDTFDARGKKSININNVVMRNTRCLNLDNKDIAKAVVQEIKRAYKF